MIKGFKVVVNFKALNLFYIAYFFTNFVVYIGTLFVGVSDKY